MENIAEAFKGLSEPVRVRIIALLYLGELCVCDLMAVLDMPQSTISRHLSYLKRTGWTLSRRKGKWVYYRWNGNAGRLQRDVLDMLPEWLAGNKEFAADRNALAVHLKNKTEEACSD